MKLAVCVSLLFTITTSLAQPQQRKVSTTINNPAINVFAPFISLDGSTLLYTSDYADLDPLVYYSQRGAGDWKDPVELPKFISSKLNFLKGYTLSPDGKTIYVTSIKSGGVGGYDLWSSEFKSGSWGELKNLYAPLNTRLHEATPTFTPDGNTIYFMRCDKIEYQKASGCKIFTARKKPSGQWDEPTELPAHINTGNSQTPRIMADSETLIFSSDKISPNKGGMDLYVAKLSNGVWGNPQPLETLNTPKDDQFVSAQANGRYLLKEAPGKFKTEIVEYLLPDHLRPRGVMKVEGIVKDNSGATAPAYISVIELTTNKRIYSGRPATDGSFFLFLTEGNAYELSIDPEDGIFTYYAKRYDLTTNEPLRNDKLSVVLKKLTAGDELFLDDLRFKPATTTLDKPETELRRLSRLLKNYSNLNFEIHVLLLGYVEDTEPSSPDLTELVVDSTYTAQQVVDSLGRFATRDSLLVRKLYHNDRTEKQAQTIVDQLVELGLDRKNFTIFVSAKPEEVEENKGTIIKLVARAKR
jgi:hypothetical protein